LEGEDRNLAATRTQAYEVIDSFRQVFRGSIDKYFLFYWDFSVYCYTGGWTSFAYYPDFSGISDIRISDIKTNRCIPPLRALSSKTSGST
jgi:hypothetical protein